MVRYERAWRGREGNDVLAMSSAEHLLDTHAVMLSVILALPVVHWHFVSVSSQPAAGTAVAKHASCVYLSVIARVRERVVHWSCAWIGRG
jgi:hypothetical protein